MLDLTGANLVSYLIRVIRSAVAKNPRFNQTIGEVTFQSNNMIQYRDVQITVKDVSTSGNRLSPNYFMCNQYGRALVAKVEGKEGTFIEWIKETDITGQTPVAGVYYLNVDAVDEKTNDVDLTIQEFRWVEGKYYNAAGSIAYLREGIDGTTLTAKDLTTGDTISIEGFSNYIILLVPTQTLQLYYPDGTALTPMTDYWYQRSISEVIIQNTLGGSEVANIPNGVGAIAWVANTAYAENNFVRDPNGDIQFTALGGTSGTIQPTWNTTPQGTTLDGDIVWSNIGASWVSFTLFDQDNYQLQQNKDWTYFGKGFIQLGQWSPSGSVITAVVVTKMNPATTVGTNPENILQVGVRPTESLAQGQVFIHTTENDYYNAIVNTDGTVTLPQLLKPGEWVRWEVRIDAGQTTCRGKKFAINGYWQTYIDPQGTPQYYIDPITQQKVDAFPGLAVAMGDSVIAGDQAAIIVSPTTTETYEVYGSKENLDFTLEFRSNDLQTSSDLSELLKQQLLIMRRQNMEADGITIFEARRTYRGQQRDSSGTAPMFIYSVSISASADWKVFIPKVTRMASFEITDTTYIPDFQGKLEVTPRVQTLGTTRFQFVQHYS